MTDWRERAACRQVPTAVFYPETTGGVADYGAARAICAGCEVSAQCLAEADDFGLWGGQDPRERSGLERQKPGPKGRKPIRHGTEGGSTQHYRRGEKPCPACAEAKRAANAGRYWARRSA